MRQLVVLLEKIRIRTTKKEYYRMSFAAKLQRAEIASLDEILGIPSEADESSPFDEKADKEMEARALALLEERKRDASVRRSTNKN